MPRNNEDDPAEKVSDDYMDTAAKLARMLVSQYEAGGFGIDGEKLILARALLSAPPSVDERQQAMEQAAELCDQRAEAAHAMALDNMKRDWHETAKLDSLQAAVHRSDAQAIRALSSAPKAR